MIRLLETATAPFSIGGPSMVMTARARMIIFSAVAAVCERRKYRRRK
jgi:hypothetical protein